MNTFDILFETESTGMRYKNHYNFFYYRRSPRGNAKFGITQMLWERLRMQQQGTDEVIQFDFAWLMKATSEYKIKNLEGSLKQHFKNRCIFEDTKRAGHTEWHRDISPEEFINAFKFFAVEYGIELLEVANEKKPYIATRSSECPLKSPNNAGKLWIQGWAADKWKLLSAK